MFALVWLGLLSNNHKMKSTITKITLIPTLVLGLLVGLAVQATAQQSFEGMATYRSSINIESINTVGQNMNPDQQEAIRKQLAQQMQRDYTLRFNLQEATWQENAALEPATPTANTGGMQIRVQASNNRSYVNPSKNEFVEETDIFGKKFLIQDELPVYQWQITSEQKQIGDYTVVKAVYTDIRTRTEMTLSDSEQKTQTVQDTTLITAWYTPQIPVSQGPDNTYGLPGLILELKNGNMTYLCTKIELNPAQPVVIKKPTKGKVVTRAEAEKIQDEKMQEMMQKYNTGDGGQTRVIRIGG